MRTIEILVSDGNLIIYDWIETDPSHPAFVDENPICLPLEDVLAKFEMEGYGKNLSKLVVELTGYSWVDKQYLDAVIKFIRENYPEADISWKETFEYLDGMK